MTGTLTMKTEPHQNDWSSAPPTIGPRGRPTIVDRLSTSMARGRSWGSNRTTTADMASGIRAAAPRPRSERAAISDAGLAAYAHQSEPTPKTARAADGQPLAAEPVAQHPGRQQHRGQHQQVGVGEPLQLRGRGVQVGGDVGQGHVEDGHVETDDQEGQRGGAERPPARRRVGGHDSDS